MCMWSTCSNGLGESRLKQAKLVYEGLQAVEFSGPFGAWKGQNDGRQMMASNSSSK